MFAGRPPSATATLRTLSTLTWRVVTNATKLPRPEGWRRPQAGSMVSRAAALEPWSTTALHAQDLQRIAHNAGAVEVQTAARSSPRRCWVGRCARLVHSAARRRWKLGARLHQLEDSGLGERPASGMWCRRAGSTT